MRRLAAATLLALAGCQPTPPPKPPPTPPPVVEPPPPPPPPKCESLEEKCVSTPESRIAIDGTKLTLAPPPGWTFAHATGGTIALSNTSAIAVAVFAIENPKKPPPRALALAAIVEKLAVTFPKRKGKLDFPKRADKTSTVGTLKVAFYQLDGAVRETKKGPLLVFTTSAPEGGFLVGAGFVPEDDDSNADAAILKAVESISDAAANNTARAPQKDAAR